MKSLIAFALVAVMFIITAASALTNAKASHETSASVVKIIDRASAEVLDLTILPSRGDPVEHNEILDNALQTGKVCENKIAFSRKDYPLRA